MIRDNSWYNSNSVRPWPVEDTTTPILPHDLILDLHLVFARTGGRRAYISAAYSGPRLLTVLIADESSKEVLASYSAAKPVEQGVMLRLKSHVDGAGGWIVFGSGVTRELSIRVSDPASTRLLPQTARAYEPALTSSLGALSAAAGLTGAVVLEAGNDIDIHTTTVTIDGDARKALWVGLKETTERNLYEEYAGPCGRRPQSRNCASPEPLERVNSVAPDCCGVLYIEFRGCADISHVLNAEGGILVSCGFGLEDACTSPSRLPDSRGRLPNQYDDLCQSDYGYTVPPVVDLDTTEPPPLPVDPYVDDSLPWSEAFETMSLGQLTVVSGSFSVINRDSRNGVGLGGEIDIIIPDAEPEQSTVVFTRAHGLAVGDSFLVRNSAVSGYNVRHVVTEVDGTAMVTTNVPYSSDSEGGVWLRLGVGASWPGGKYVGSITNIWDSDGDTDILTGEPHGVAVNDLVQVLGASVSDYNTQATVTAATASATLFSASTAYTSDSTGGFYFGIGAGIAGRLAQIERNAANGRAVLVFYTAHGLVVGDEVLVFDNATTANNRAHVVDAVLSTTQVLTNISVAEILSSGGYWRKSVGKLDNTGHSIVSSESESCIAVYDQGAALESDWVSWFKLIEVDFRLLNGSFGAKHNAGVVLNYKDSETSPGDKDYYLVEVSADGAKELRVWRVAAGSFTLLGFLTLPLLSLEARYRLRVRVTQYAAGSSDARVYVSLEGLDDTLVVTASPVRLLGYGLPSGYIGLYAKDSSTVFEIVTLRNAE